MASWYKWRRWYLWFLMFGIFGNIAEIVVGSLYDWVLWGSPLWLYYNGFYTSVESFFWFGFLGCIGLRLVLTRYNLTRKSKTYEVKVV